MGLQFSFVQLGPPLDCKHPQLRIQYFGGNQKRTILLMGLHFGFAEVGWHPDRR